MSVDKLVDSTQLDSDLTDVADEIRTAGGTLLPLSFPDDYVVAIGDIGNTEIKTVSGSIAHFEDALARKAQDLTADIEPVQDLHGYDNPWPDGGQKNKLPLPTAETKNGVTLTRNSDGTVTITGTATSNAYFDFFAGTFDSTAFAGYKFVCFSNVSTTMGGVKCRVSASNRTALQEFDVPGTGTIVDNGTGLYFAIRVNGGHVIPSGGILIKPMIIASGEDETTFTPYSNICPISGWTGANIHVSPTTVAADGTTHSITFPSAAGTVYGGTLDVTTGKLTVDRAMVDLGTLTWYTSAAKGHTRFRALVSGVKQIASPNILASLMCSYYQTKTANETYNGTLGISLQQNCDDVYIYDPQMETMSATDFKTAMSGVQLVYELATPIVYDLSPTEVTTLLGTNNVWADTGDSTVQYIAPKAQIPSAQGVYF